MVLSFLSDFEPVVEALEDFVADLGEALPVEEDDSAFLVGHDSETGLDGEGVHDVAGTADEGTASAPFGQFVRESALVVAEGGTEGR